MSLIDLQTLLSDSQNLAQTAGTYVSTNSIDLGASGTVPPGFQARGNPPHDAGVGKMGALYVQVDETFTSGGSATVDFQLIMSANADLSSPTVLQTTGAIAKATLVAGYQARLEIPYGVTARYLGVQYVIATATTTAGKCTAAVVLDKPSYHV